MFKLTFNKKSCLFRLCVPFVNLVVEIIYYCLIVSLPPTSASVERSFSALKRVKSYSRNTMSQSRLNNLSVLAIERGLVKELIKDKNFYTKILDDFATTKSRKIELIYKYVFIQKII
jgi:hypothetical protein